MKEITTIGVDLAKSAFTVHGTDAAGHTVLRNTVRRERLMELIAGLPPCLVGMEACGGAHELPLCTNWPRGSADSMSAPAITRPLQMPDIRLQAHPSCHNYRSASSFAGGVHIRELSHLGYPTATHSL
jgi:hypothetical protein